MSLLKLHCQNELLFLEEFELAFNTFNTSSSIFPLSGNFDRTIDENELKDLLNVFYVENLTKEPTCYKSKTAIADF